MTDKVHIWLQFELLQSVPRMKHGTLCMEKVTREFRPIGDYAIIGDCSTAALISKIGSIDWLCWSRFDSPSVFASILDREKGGRFVIAPTGEFEVERRYLPDTNVLETTFRTETGEVRLTDFMPVAEYDAYDQNIWPAHALVRRVECTRGEVEMLLSYEPRLDYGRQIPRLKDRGKMGYSCQFKAGILDFRTDLEVELVDGGASLRGKTKLHEGEVRDAAMTFDSHEPAVLPVLGEGVEDQLERTVKFWREWVGHCTYDGRYREHLIRSLLTLKLMTFSRTGAVVAAPTTSLPEGIGGVRNWDYRYCWIRDAGMTIRVFMELGYRKEADAFFAWLLYSARHTLSRLKIMYDVYGRFDLDEYELPHLEGYRGSKPVRVGNGAVDQLQLDTYGELILAAYEYVKEGGHLDGWQSRMLIRAGIALLDKWQLPDEGIWEKRSEPRHNTYSKVMSWVAMDRLIKLHDAGHMDVPRDRFADAAREIRETVEREGYNEELGAFVSEFGGDRMDASLLLLAMYQFVEPDDPRMVRTYELIQERLARGSLLFRYEEDDDDGLPGEEHAFGLCSFWDDEYLALLGDVDKAIELFESMLEYQNDVGLYAEMIHEDTGEHIGNFPQAFTHIGLINTLLMIAHKTGDRRSDKLVNGMPTKRESKTTA